MKIAEYVKNQPTMVVSPIWDGKKEFHFLCLGHLEMAEAMGFLLETVSPWLTIVKKGQICSEEDLKRWMHKKFNYACFEEELQKLPGMKNMCLEEGGLCGGGCFGPLTVVSGILGAENLMRLIVKQPEFVCAFVEYTTGFLKLLAQEEKREGIDFFWIAEPLASLLSPENFWRFSGKYIRDIYQKSEVPGFLHVCGKTIKHTRYLEKTGAEVLSIDACTNIGECIRMVQKDTVIMGNVSPSTLRFGTKEEVIEEVRGIMKSCRGFENFVLSTGCSVMEETPRENVEILFEAMDWC